jgi:hypothetical protein
MRRDAAEVIAWVAALREPELVRAWTLRDWDRVVRLGRRLRLLARLAESLAAAGLLDAVPEPARRHLVAEQRVSLYRTAAMTWALVRIRAALGAPAYPCVLLKGAAYLGQGLPIAPGRMPSDVDILVPRAHLADAQRRLRADGWAEQELDAHDQRYYREWSHEVPPMRHPLHLIELDLHHGIRPPVGVFPVDADALLAGIQPSAWPGWHVLQPVDQLLHCAVHLVMDSELRDRLRDLVDLDGLLRHFGRDAGFVEALLDRAGALGLREPLAIAARRCIAWLDTPIPSAAQRELASWEPRGLRRAWLLPMLDALLTPTDPDRAAPWTQSLAAALFLARHQAGRLPLRLLVPHVWHKLRTGGADGAAPRDAA